jgi:hypothetical protein
MCKRCDEIDTKIEHYRWLRNAVNDQRTVEHLSAFIVDLEAEKTTLHPALPTKAVSFG